MMKRLLRRCESLPIRAAIAIGAGVVTMILIARNEKTPGRTWWDALAESSVMSSVVMAVVFTLLTPGYHTTRHFTRSEKRAYLFIGFAPIVILVAIDLVSQMLGGERIWLVMLSAIILLMAIALATGLRHGYARLHAQDFMICPTCEYPLPRESEFGRCSECGKEYISKDVRAYWSGRPEPAQESSM